MLYFPPGSNWVEPFETISAHRSEIYMYKYLKQWKDRQNDLHFPTEDLARWCRDHLHRTAGPVYRILDIGLGTGRDLKAIAESCPKGTLELYGVESRQTWVEQRQADGIATSALNIEQEPLPFRDEFFDVVLSNQVIEHTKELFWIFSEIARVLKKGGLAVIGCPNLGSWHNRVALLFGRQPPCMRLLGSHVRGITKPGFRELIEDAGYFGLVGYHGANFYPFGGGANRMLAKLFPTLAATHYFILRRTPKIGSFLEVLDRNAAAVFDTPYFHGVEAIRAAGQDPQRRVEGSDA
jgi:SAM-dependent methyltransferase